MDKAKCWIHYVSVYKNCRKTLNSYIKHMPTLSTLLRLVLVVFILELQLST